LVSCMLSPMVASSSAMQSGARTWKLSLPTTGSS